MARLRPGQQQRFTIVGLIVICVGLLVLDSQGRSFSGARTTADHAFSPVERGLNHVVDPMGNFFSGLPDVGSNKRKMDALKRENAQLRSELKTTSVNANRAESLRRLGLLVDRTGFRVATASLLDFGPSLGFEWTVRIDVGTAQGVKAGMTVMNADGLVGRVKRVTSSTSIVLLAVDPGSSAGVRVSRSGELGLATGAGLGNMSFVPLNPQTKVKVGDTLVTGPYGASTYAAGIPLGTVATASRSGATIKPLVGYSSLDVVAVVLGSAKAASHTPQSQASGQGR